MRLFILLALISFNSFAVIWDDLEISKTYKLTQSFQLKQKERSGSFIDFSKGDEIVFKELAILSEIRVLVYMFQYKKCPGNAMKTEMSILSVVDTSPVVEVGAELDHCLLNIYIEASDIYTNGFIEE